MGRKTKTAKGRLDKYYYLAKEQGYRSRAAFKLIQINRKFNILKDAKAVVDLCAAPGGWMQVCEKTLPRESLIIGVDLVPIKKIANTIALQEDITTQRCRTQLRRELQGWTVDVVLNDGAPNVGGAWDVDAHVQVALSLHALHLACDMLKPGGHFVSKVFRSKDYNSFLWACQQFFKKVTPFKPPSSRAASAEIFLVCEGYLAPKKIDQRLFDPKHVFADVADAVGSQAALTAAVMDANQDDAVADAPAASLQKMLRMRERKRANRAGYANTDGGLIDETASLAQLALARDPVAVLARYTRISTQVDDVPEFVWKSDDGADKAKALLNEDLRDACADLKQCSQTDMKKLLKLRAKLRKLLVVPEGAMTAVERADLQKQRKRAQEEQGVTEQMDSEDELRQVEEMLSKATLKAKRRAHKLKQKQRQRALVSGLAAVGAEELEEDQELFTGLAGRILTGDGESTQKMQVDSDEEVDEFYAPVRHDHETDDDSDNDLAYLGQVDDELALSYRMYAARTGRSRRERKRIAQLGMDRDNTGIETGTEAGTEASTMTEEERLRAFAEGKDGDEEFLPFRKQKALARQTRSRRRRIEYEEVQKGLRAASAMGVSVDNDDADVSGTAEQRRAQKEMMQTVNDGIDFETAPAEEDYSSDEDEDAVAERLAVAQAMLRKRGRQEIMDGAYNRYAFAQEDLPAWFVADEERHSRAALPVTRAEVGAAKQRLRAINARPATKALEAKARRKLRAMRQFNKLKSHAEAVLNSNEMSAADKLKVIKKMYAKKKAHQKQKGKFYVVNKKSGGSGTAGKPSGSRTVLVDKRLRNDKRAERRAAKRKSKGGRRRRR